MLRPTVHERRIVSSGTILEPAADPDRWAIGTQLDIAHTPVVHQPLGAARRFADGLSSWLVRRTDGDDEWVVFDRPAGSERDLVVLSDVLDATIVQRHPSGSVRVVGSFGVLRWVELAWHYEPPLSTWIDSVTAPPFTGERDVLEAMLEFAIHDLGSWGIGSLLIYRPSPEPGPPVEERLPTPPPLRIRTPSHLAPLRHALAQVDGAAVFDAEGVLRQLGRAPGAEPDRGGLGRGVRWYPPHLRAPLQLRRPVRHRRRGERRRPRVGVAQRRRPRPVTGWIGFAVSASGEAPTVRDDRPQERFVFEKDGEVGELAYEVDGGRLFLLHTEVADALRGQGVAGQLVDAAVSAGDRRRPHRGAVVPLRPAVAA